MISFNRALTALSVILRVSNLPSTIRAEFGTRPTYSSDAEICAPGGVETGAAAAPAVEPDLDKVEKAFVDGFLAATDPTSFLRLARVPFEMTANGASLRLLRVEIDALTDVGSLTPHLGGGSFRYDPLPANFVSQRRRLRFVYFDGANSRPLSYAELREIDRRE